MIDFFSLSTDEICQGIEIMNGLTATGINHPLKEFEYDPRLHILATLWQECNQDRTLMKLRYFDLIQNLSSMNITAQRLHGHA